MKIAIIGAGLAGLAAGAWLSRAGRDVEIFEAGPLIGGRALTIKRPNSTDLVDVGTQYFHTNYKRALKLISDVGLKSDIHKISGKTRFFDERVKHGTFTTGHRVPYIASGSILANLKMSLCGALRMLRHPIDPFAVLENSSADDLSAGEVIKDPFEWEYNARALISAGALLEPEGGDVSYLHLIRLMRIIVMTDYLTLNNGVASLHERLAEDQAVHFNTSIHSLRHERNRVVGVITKDEQHLDFDHTIIATTPKACADLMPEEWKPERAFLNSIKQPKALTVNLFLDCALEKKVWSYVFRPDPNRLISFCVDAAKKNPQMVPSGKAALQAWICHPASERVFELSDEQIIEAVVIELAENFPNLQQNIECFYIHRAAYAVPQTPPKHNAKAQMFLKQIDAHEGVDVCGDYLSGGYMECALWSSERAVKNLSL